MTKLTNRQAIGVLDGLWSNPLLGEVHRQAFEIGIKAIKALEQEPCEDAISRQSAIFLANDLKQDLPDDERIADMVIAHNEGILEYQTQLSLLPPVNPQPKTGHWIDDKCSVCGKGIEDLIDSREWYRNEKPNFCPFCGVKLADSQESEE